MPDVASLAMKVTTTGAKEAARDLDALTQAGKRAEAANNERARSQDAVARSTRNVIKPTQDFTREAAALGRAAGSGNLGGALLRLPALLGPVGTGVAAVATVMGAGVIAADRYTEAMRKLDAVSTGVGRMAGLTAGSIQRAAQASAAAAGISVVAAEKQATAYAQTGRIGEEAMKSLIAITGKYAEATGVTAEVATRDLAAAASDLGKGVDSVNGKLGAFNDTQAQHIKQLEAEGDHTVALREFLGGLDASLVTTTGKVGGLAGQWQSVMNWASNAGRAMALALAGGQGGDPVARIDQLTKAAAKARGANSVTGNNLATGYEKEIADLQKSLKLQSDINKLAADNRTGAEARKAIDGLLPKEAALKTLQADRVKIQAALRVGQISQAEATRALAAADKEAADLVKVHTSGRVAHTKATKENKDIVEELSRSVLQLDTDLGRLQESLMSDTQRQAAQLKESLDLIDKARARNKLTINEAEGLKAGATLKYAGTTELPDYSKLSTKTAGMEQLEGILQAANDNREAFREYWRDTFSYGVRAALDGDLRGFLSSFFKDSLASSLSSVLSRVTGLGGSAGGATGGLGGLSSLTSLASTAGRFLGIGGAAAGASGAATALAGIPALTTAPSLVMGGLTVSGGVTGGLTAGATAAAGAGGLSGMLGSAGALLASNPVGWGIAAVGAAAALFGAFSGGSKKAEKEAARAKAAEEALTQARSEAAAAAEKAAALYSQRRGLEIELLDLSGQALLAVTERRKDERAAMDPSIQGLYDQKVAWQDYNEAVSKADAAIADAKSNLSAAYERESSAIEATRSKFQDFADTLKAFREQLTTGDLAGNNPAQQYALTRAQFGSTADLAASGSQAGLSALPGAASTFLAASKAAARTNQDYQRDRAVVLDAVRKGEAYSGAQVDVATAQLDALNASVAGLIDINGSVLSVRDAINALSGANAARSAVESTRPATPGVDTSAAAADWSKGGALWNQWAAAGSANSFVAALSESQIVADWNAKPQNFIQEYNNFKANGGSLSALDAYWHLTPGMAAAYAARNGLPAFAMGGSFVVGGNPGTDQNILSVNGRAAARVGRGETVTVSPQGASNAEMVAVLRSMEARLAGIERSSDKTARIQQNVWEDGGVTARDIVEAA